MKKSTLSVALILTLCASMTLSSCIGSFQLTNKLLTWNSHVGSKFVNELVFIAFWILPVYEVSSLADVIVLNSIEFWSGKNPVTASTKTIEGKNGKYMVSCDNKGYTITGLNNGSKVRLDFNEETKTWSYTLPSGESAEIFTYVDDTHMSLPVPDGTNRIIEISEAGLYAYQSIVTGSQFAMK